jgi:hypothetical protein
VNKTEVRPDILQFQGYIEGVKHSETRVRTPWVRDEAIRMQTKVFLLLGGNEYLASQGHDIFIAGDKRYNLPNFNFKRKRHSALRFEELASQVEARRVEQLRQFGKGDLRGLQAPTREETTSNLYAHLQAEYQAMGLHLTQEQMITHVTDTVGLADSEAEAAFSGSIDESFEEKEQRITRIFLSVAYVDSMLLPGVLKERARKPAPVFDGRTFVDFLTEGRSDDIVYSRYKLHGAENNP